MIEGMVLADPDSLERVDGTTVVKRKDVPIQDKVGIVSGGGSGHEPAHAGYIGKGMLDAAVLGEVFTSPSVDQVFRSEEHTSELQSRGQFVCRLLLDKKNHLVRH